MDAFSAFLTLRVKTPQTHTSLRRGSFMFLFLKQHIGEGDDTMCQTSGGGGGFRPFRAFLTFC